MVAGIMEHIEEAGIHSGDSACSLPVYSLTDDITQELQRQTVVLAKALNVIGLMNVQFAIKDGVIYILEVNPRASRTVPFVAKTIGSPLAKIAARVMAGETVADAGRPYGGIQAVSTLNHIAVKEAVFPFAKFPGVDVLLGPEMRSTGEVMGLDRSFAVAFGKAQLGAGNDLPRDGVIYVSVKNEDKPKVTEACRRLVLAGYRLLASDGTQQHLNAHGVAAERINKVADGRPHIEDAIRNRQVQLVINTTDGTKAISDSKPIRRAALMQKVPYFTTVKGAVAVADALVALKNGQMEVHTLQSYRSA
jgi:carbamoyl-phosphate synthase large subunit